MNCTAFDIAQRFVGLKEVAGPTSNPHVLAMLQIRSGMARRRRSFPGVLRS